MYNLIIEKINNRSKRLRWLLEYIVAYAILRILGLLPLNISRMLGSVLGMVLYRVDLRHRCIAEDNIRRAFEGEMSLTEMKGVLKRSFQHLGILVAEFSYLNKLNPRLKSGISLYLNKSNPRLKSGRSLKLNDGGLERYVVFEGEEHYLNARRTAPAVILISGHLGNWEWLVAHRLKFGRGVIVAKDMRNIYLDALVKHIRHENGLEIIPVRRSIHRIIKRIKEGEDIVMLIDQNSLRNDGVFVDFFGKKACTHYAPALLAMRYRLPVVPFFAIRDDAIGKLRVIYQRPIEVFSSDDHKNDLVINTQRLTDVVEKNINKYPEQWLWVHQRWRTQPLDG